ncbi:putative DNA-directed RNA polymerase subunit delta [Gossypium australe]|uniref:Putative DNA-directed RNA polymerase subunit delta n=1 Tax=Gossypium australe TaxID=47621 RepID=A0A5B6VBR4_9ROSI|nr:putative DNA-directed RNA polymerase subunit delta [Gossypium australe]
MRWKLSAKLNNSSSKCTLTRNTLIDLKDQMSRMMEMMSNIQRKIGIGIPSNTENYPQKDGKEIVNAIALQSSKTLDNSCAPIQKDEDVQKPINKPLDETKLEELVEQVVGPVVQPSLNVNLPLLELIDKIPKYFKYLKKIMSRHKKLKKGEQINIDTSCSAIMLRKYPRN